LSFSCPVRTAAALVLARLFSRSSSHRAAFAAPITIQAASKALAITSGETPMFGLAST
jgi:hypothetical protein